MNQPSETTEPTGDFTRLTPRGAAREHARAEAIARRSLLDVGVRVRALAGWRAGETARVVYVPSLPYPHAVRVAWDRNGQCGWYVSDALEVVS